MRGRWCCCLVALLVVGCTSARSSNTARTAREQLLISNAIDHALAKTDFSALQGTKVFIEDKYLDCTDKAYLLGSVRHRAMINGASIVAKAEDADIVLELRSGGVGTDTADSFVGTPEIVLPGMLTLPEVRLISRNHQSALAKIGLVAYDAKTHQLLGAGGVSSSLSNDNNWYVFGVGPYQDGELKNEVKRTTGRQPGQPHQELPSAVAFAAPAGEDEGPARLRFAGEQQPE